MLFFSTVWVYTAPKGVTGWMETKKRKEKESNHCRK